MPEPRRWQIHDRPAGGQQPLLPLPLLVHAHPLAKATHAADRRTSDRHVAAPHLAHGMLRVVLPERTAGQIVRAAQTRQLAVVHRLHRAAKALDFRPARGAGDQGPQPAGRHHHVVVDEDDQLSMRRRNACIARPVRVPRCQRQGRIDALHRHRLRRAGVDDDHLESLPRIVDRQHRCRGPGQLGCPVVGGDDNRHERTHGLASLHRGTGRIRPVTRSSRRRPHRDSLTSNTGAGSLCHTPTRGQQNR